MNPGTTNSWHGDQLVLVESIINHVVSNGFVNNQ